MAASKIHKFLTSFMKLVLEVKLLPEFTFLKSYVGISDEPAQNMFKVIVYTDFTTSLVSVPLTLNMKLFAGQLSSFSEDMSDM